MACRAIAESQHYHALVLRGPRDGGQRLERSLRGRGKACPDVAGGERHPFLASCRGWAVGSEGGGGGGGGGGGRAGLGSESGQINISGARLRAGLRQDLRLGLSRAFSPSSALLDLSWAEER